jgi:hypothetical protein
MCKAGPVSSRWHSPWLAALGYFACYVPYAAITKAVSSDMGPGAGLRLLPLSTLASVIAAATFLIATGWWRAAAWRAGPRRDAGLALASGLCASAVIATTTLSYTFDGTSILLMMLLMRGGVLVLAPLVDTIAGRRIARASWLALGLSLAGIAVVTVADAEFALSTAAAIDVAVYLLAYFVRLRVMTRLAKSADVASTRRFFAREQCVSSPALLLALTTVALVGAGASADHVAAGFGPPALVAIAALGIGVLSQGTGIFGALVLLSPRENSFSVPLNRAASILAGVAAQLALVAVGSAGGVDARELVGAALVVAAVVVLAWPPRPARAT